MEPNAVNSNIFCVCFLHLPKSYEPLRVRFVFLSFLQHGRFNQVYLGTHGTSACSFKNISVFRTSAQVLRTACRTIFGHETHSNFKVFGSLKNSCLHIPTLCPKHRQKLHPDLEKYLGKCNQAPVPWIPAADVTFFNLVLHSPVKKYKKVR
jgi:hypothetical protein